MSHRMHSIFSIVCKGSVVALRVIYDFVLGKLKFNSLISNLSFEYFYLNISIGQSSVCLE